jgi:phosphate transport system substrate-binding protein
MPVGTHLLRIGRTAGIAAVALTIITGTISSAATVPLPPDNQDAGTIAGIGATFPAPIYNEWFAQFKNQYDGTTNPITAKVSFTYAANGSGAGVTAIKNQTADYGGSDAALSNADIAATAGTNGGVIHIPATIGGVVLAYRVAGVKTTTGKAVTLKLTPALVSKIYDGEIGYWDNAAIKAANPNVRIPHTRIVPVRRSDSSGTTFVFQTYLYTVASKWRCILGAAGPQKAFPTGAQTCLSGKSIPGVGAPRNSGVAAKVASTNGAIGYMEYAYARNADLKMARLKNAAGIYVSPTTYGFSAAAAATIGRIPSDLRAAPIVQAPGATSWPITAYSFLLVYKQSDFMGAVKAKMWVAYLYWALTSGQSYARSMGYAPLPATVKTKALAKVHTITFGGSTVWP